MVARSWTAETSVLNFESARLRFAMALVLSALVHALVSSGVMSGPGSRGSRTGAAPVPAALKVELAAVVPEPPIATPEPQREEPVVATDLLPKRKSFKPPAAARSEQPRSAGDGGFAEIPDPTYYAARQLDVYPAPESALDLRYPPEAAASSAGGRVVLLVLIASDGVVDEASVVEAEPPGVFDGDAVRALRTARFRPAIRNGRAVKSRLLVELNYGSTEKATP